MGVYTIILYIKGTGYRAEQCGETAVSVEGLSYTGKIDRDSDPGVYMWYCVYEMYSLHILAFIYLLKSR